MSSTTNPYMALVTQRVAYVGMQLDMAESHLSPTSISARLKMQSCLGAALMYLRDAYILYLNELAHYYQLSGDIDTLDELLALLDKHGKVGGEAQELAQLEANSQTWLAVMKQLYQQRYYVQTGTQSRSGELNASIGGTSMGKSQGSNGLGNTIPIVNISDDPTVSENSSTGDGPIETYLQSGGGLTIGLLSAIVDEMKHLFERQREAMTEY